MKQLLYILLATPALALAQGAFDGTWVGDVAATKLPDKPDVYVLDQGVFACQSCVPTYKIRSDGSDQAVTGHPYYDTVSLKIVDAHTAVVTRKKAGKVMSIDTLVAAADGTTLTDSFEDRSESTPMTGRTTATRIGTATAGAHAVSGSWRTVKFDNASQNAITAIIKTTAHGISVHDLNGVGYDVLFDGKTYPVKGDSAHMMVTLKRIDAHTIEETDSIDGKIEFVNTMTLSADGRTIDNASEDKRHGTVTHLIMRRKT